MTKKASFVLYCENLEQVAMLSDEQAGKLLKALMTYVDKGIEPTFSDPLLKMAFSFMCIQLRKDMEKWEETCKARSENGKKGGAQKGNQNARKQAKQAKQADSDSDSECDSECENENDVDCECDSECVTAHEADTPHTREQQFASLREGTAAASPTPPAPTAQSVPQAAQPLPTPTPHTAKAQMDCGDVLNLARQMGYAWDRSEAERFLAYNRDRGRSDGWDFAARRWEEQRQKRAAAKGRTRPAPKVTDTLADELTEYEALSNRFLSDCEPEKFADLTSFVEIPS